MSIENRPYFNAAGFVVDLVAAIDKHIRGDAEPYREEIIKEILKVDAIFSSYTESIDMLVTSIYKRIERNKNAKSRSEGQGNSEDIPVQG